MKPSYLFAGGILGATILFLLILGLVKGAHKEEAKAADAPPPPMVQTMTVDPVQRTYTVSIRGRTEAARTVIVRSETAGVVASTPAREGAFVGRGQVLCRLSVDARQAAVDQARANFRLRQIQLQSSESLAADGFRSPTQVMQDKANMDAAQAALRQAEVALDQVNVRAPFSGVFDHRDAEVGAYLGPGQPCGTVIELDPLIIVGDVAETQAAKIRVGAWATATLVSGQTIGGTVRFVARDADPTTRTYRVEIVVRNPGGAVRSGFSAEVKIDAGVGPAHLAPVSALVLDAQGRQGLRYLVAGNRVAFAPVVVLEETPQGVWVAGLTGQTRIITVGQSYVSEGQVVRLQEPAPARPAVKTAAPPAKAAGA